MLLEALTTGDENAPVLPTHSSPSPPLRDADKERGKDREKDIEEDRREMSLDAVPILDSSNFIFDSFLRRHERDMTKGSPANEQRVIGTYIRHIELHFYVFVFCFFIYFIHL